MSVEEIRKVVKQRPFKPFMFHLGNGENAGRAPSRDRRWE